ncbi:MAG: PIN domain-containing protein [Acidobacteria bacterium]|nr:PIN domain-containing protein [Acidobacteriota bacterium]
MRRIRVYVDTSVFGGIEDEEFSDASRRFFQRVAEGDYIVLISEETYRELSKSPESVRDILTALPSGSLEDVLIESETLELAAEYIRSGILGEASRGDALHVAAATVAGADLILSWNFKHIVNYNRIRRFNGVNVLLGYRSMTILSPREVGDESEE